MSEQKKVVIVVGALVGLGIAGAIAKYIFGIDDLSQWGIFSLVGVLGGAYLAWKYINV